MGMGDIGRRGGDQDWGFRVGPSGWYPSIVGVEVVGGASVVMIGGSLFLRVGLVHDGEGGL